MWTRRPSAPASPRPRDGGRGPRRALGGLGQEDACRGGRPALVLLYLALAALAGFSAACTGAGDAPAPARGDAGSPEACQLREGETPHEIVVGGARRRYVVSVGPRAARSERAPVVFLWHGFGSSAREISGALRAERDFPEAIVVRPQGLPRRFPGLGSLERDGWQIEQGELGDRDLAFFDAMLEDLTARYCVDESRIFTTGFSNGAFFSNLLGCVRGDRLAAIAAVAGGGPREDDCRGHVAAQIFHGTEDGVVPYRFGVASFEHWAEANACTNPGTPPPRDCVDADACRLAVEMCSYPAEHQWPRRGTERVVRFFRAAPANTGGR